MTAVSALAATLAGRSPLQAAIQLAGEVDALTTVVNGGATLLTASSGTYTVPTGVYLINGVLMGGGGGGGGVSNANAAAGGGQAGILIEFAMFVTPGQTISYTNGAGGTAGANSGGNGGTGGDTTFGDFTAKGGLGGTGSTSGNGAGFATQTSTVIAVASASSMVPTAARFITSMNFTGLSAGVTASGGPGIGYWGVGGAVATNAAGKDATGYGASGGGAGSTTSGAFIGGKGSPGAIMVWY